MPHLLPFAVTCPLCNDLNEVACGQIVDRRGYRYPSCDALVRVTVSELRRYRRLIQVRNAATQEAGG